VNLGLRMREARLAAKLTLAEVAEKAGLSAGYVSEVERNLANPSIGAVNRIVQAIGLPAGALFSVRDDGSEAGRPAVPEGNIPCGVVRHDRRKGIMFPGSNILI